MALREQGSSKARPRPTPGRRATIRDVAARAGVATSTVSRALSDPDRVHPATRGRVLEAARAVHYHSGRRSGAATDTAGGAVALLIPDVANPFYAEIMRGAQRQLTASGYLQILADTEESAAAEELSLRRVSRLADGAILAATRLTDAQIRAGSASTPIVLINRRLAGFSSVCLDTALGFRQAIHHLASLGHGTVAYLSGPADSWSDRARWRAIAQTARETGVAAVRLGPFAPHFAGGSGAADALINSGAGACVAFNDLLAAGAIRRLSERGVDVPGEISVVGCDDLLSGGLSRPALTTVAGDLELVGRTAVQILLAALDQPGAALERVTLPAHLEIRGSTARRAA